MEENPHLAELFCFENRAESPMLPKRISSLKGFYKVYL